MPIVYDDIADICRNREKLIDWLREQELLGDFSGICNTCFKGNVYLRSDKSYSKDQIVWRCSNGSCNKKTSISEGSWFSGSHLLLEQIVKLTYYWVYKCPAEFVTRELKIGSEHTIVDWNDFARLVCLKVLELDSEQIGGVGTEVEIDESKFGKRIYHRGKKVDGVWVFGGIERQSKKCFFQVVEDRSADTLIPIIKKNVKPGTLILSDCWKSYNSLKDEGYTHLTVNHSIEFKNKETGACTNLIESTWNAMKKSLPRSGTQKQMYHGYLMEYVIRKKYINDKEDKFCAFIDLIKRVYPVKKREVLAPLATQTVNFNPLWNSDLNSSLDDFQL